MEQIEYSETSAYKIQTPGNYPEEIIQHTEHGKSLKSRIHENSFQIIILRIITVSTEEQVYERYYMQCRS
jgi:hypothetical protein